MSTGMTQAAAAGAAIAPAAPGAARFGLGSSGQTGGSTHTDARRVANYTAG
ncbi:MAG: hypothetical protein WA021_00355 [Minisyncoccia bacterium]